MIRPFAVLLALLMAGCGAEVAGTAAVGAKTQIDQARQAEETKAKVENQLDAAALIEKQKLEQVETATRP